jgi:hypothetical protein
MVLDENLLAQVQRLFASTEQPVVQSTTESLHLSALSGGAGITATRTLCLGLQRASDWPHLASLLESLQTELEIPLPAVAVVPEDDGGGFQCWFSLAEPVICAAGAAFLRYLATRFLSALPPARWTTWPPTLPVLPAADAPGELPLPPQYDAASGKWSAFIDPGLGGMFADEPGLEFPPSAARQAEVLLTVRSLSIKDWQRICLLVQEVEVTAVEGVAVETAVMPLTRQIPPSSSTTDTFTPTLGVGSGFADPRSFLLAVMNDVTATAALRMQAAEVLLPYFEAGKS